MNRVKRILPIFFLATIVTICGSEGALQQDVDSFYKKKARTFFSEILSFGESPPPEISGRYFSEGLNFEQLKIFLNERLDCAQKIMAASSIAEQQKLMVIDAKKSFEWMNQFPGDLDNLNVWVPYHYNGLINICVLHDLNVTTEGLSAIPKEQRREAERGAVVRFPKAMLEILPEIESASSS